MTRSEMAARIGFYAGMIYHHFGDMSDAQRWLGNAEQLTEEAYMEHAHQMQERLRAGGFIRADEDPWESANGR